MPWLSMQGCSPEEWYMYKQSPATACVPMLCHSVANIVKAIAGKNKKVLTLDLDNTLWGGVVGDVGVQGLDLGEETPVGQAHREFQKYVKEVSETGIVLTVASKNDEENAIAGLKHPDGILRPENFAVIKANWDRKDVNILQTVASLDLLPDSVVFADDNPAERHIVHENVAGAAVPELTSPESYIRTVDRGGYFEPLSLSGEDLKRNEMYRENAKRAELSLSFADYGEYLKSLDMVAATIELMAYESYKTVIPTYIDVVLKSKQANSPEDAEIVQLILDSMVYSFGWIFSSTHMGNMGKAFRVVDGTRDLTNYYQTAQTAYETALNDLIDAFASLALNELRTSLFGNPNEYVRQPP